MTNPGRPANPSKLMAENSLGELVRTLLKKRNLKGKELAQNLGVTPTAVSMVLRGKSRPRQELFSRMCEILCDGSVERDALTAAYTGIDLPDQDPSPQSDLTQEQYPYQYAEAVEMLKGRTSLIDFRREIAAVLKSLKLNFVFDVIECGVSADILVRLPSATIALECRPRSFGELKFKTDHFIGMELIRSGLCDRVIVVFQDSDGWKHLTRGGGVEFIPVSKLSSKLNELIEDNV